LYDTSNDSHQTGALQRPLASVLVGHPGGDEAPNETPSLQRRRNVGAEIRTRDIAEVLQTVFADVGQWTAREGRVDLHLEFLQFEDAADGANIEAEKHTVEAGLAVVDFMVEELAN
jgi:hypothetical protein